MIVDASVAFKWLVQEADSDLALALIGSEALAAPDLIYAEVANIVWRNAMAGAMGDISTQLSRLDLLLDQVFPCQELAVAATTLAVELRHPAYDCFYLALAIAEDTELVTADRRLLAAVAGSTHADRVRSLG